MEKQTYSGNGLNAINFTDLLLSNDEAFYKYGGNGEFSPVHKEALGDAHALYELCRDTPGQDTRIEHNGVKYRCSRMSTVSGLVFALRRPMAVVPPLSKLGYHAELIKRLITNAALPEGIQNGIILIAGKTGSGKSTTAGALIVERLTLHGGLAVTIEDPVELPLQGVYGPEGHGRCYQCADITQMGGVAATGASVLRFASPNIIMYGEIRDGKTAAEAIRAGLSGHLVLATLHSQGIKEGIERMVAYATEAIGPAASLQLATSLSCVIHQRLEGEKSSDKLQLYYEFLFVTDGIRGKIRNQQLHTLETDITQQHDQLLLLNGVRHD